MLRKADLNTYDLKLTKNIRLGHYLLSLYKNAKKKSSFLVTKSFALLLQALAFLSKTDAFYKSSEIANVIFTNKNDYVGNRSLQGIFHRGLKFLIQHGLIIKSGSSNKTKHKITENGKYLINKFTSQENRNEQISEPKKKTRTIPVSQPSSVAETETDFSDYSNAEETINFASLISRFREYKLPNRLNNDPQNEASTEEHLDRFTPIH